jgi:N-methylhydantoinase A/oxoprolinase/acetone carboxylase beta subunit
VLNAGLTGLVQRLCQAATAALTDRGIAAPLLIVGSDGSVMSAEVAVERPIETILSGPAASLAGAAHLLASPSGLPPRLTVADVGGTTTDIGVVVDGRPGVSESGATVGGHRTMVEAVEVNTIGLGGDSLVELNLRGTPELLIGPRRVRPLSDLALDERALVLDALHRVRLPYRSGATTFVRPRPVTGVGHPLSEREAALLDRLEASNGWQPLVDVAERRLDRENLDRLIDKGRVAVAGFTPTDAALVVGLAPPHGVFTDRGDGDLSAAIEAAAVLASASTTQGEPVAGSGDDLARWVVDEVARRTAEAVLATNLAADQLDPDLVDQPLIREMLDRRHRELTGHDPAGQRHALSISVAPQGPLVGLGAGSNTYHPQAAALLRVPTVSPEHGPVAGAVGAAVGAIRVTAKATITQPSRGQYRVHLPGSGDDRGDLQPAIDEAVALLTKEVERQARRAGAAEVSVTTDVTERTAEVGGKRILVEATVAVTGTGPAQTAEV